MKRTFAFALIGLLFVAITAAVVQQTDLASSIDPTFAMHVPVHANAADSGSRVDRAGYQCGVFMVNSGQADNVTATNTLVLIDSIPGTAAWQLKDSIAVDSVNNKVYEMRYTGTRRWIRLLARASGNAADTFAINALYVQGCKRAR